MRAIFLGVLLALAIPAADAQTFRNCSTTCRLVTDQRPSNRPDITSCRLFVGATQVDDKPLVGGACQFDVTIPLGQSRTYTARWVTPSEVSADSVPLALQSEALAPPTNLRLVP